MVNKSFSLGATICPRGCGVLARRLQPERRSAVHSWLGRPTKPNGLAIRRPAALA